MLLLICRKALSIQKNIALEDKGEVGVKIFPSPLVEAWRLPFYGNLVNFSKYTISILNHGMISNVRISMATRDSVVVKALVSRKWDPSLDPGLDDTWVKVVFGFSPGWKRLLWVLSRRKNRHFSRPFRYEIQKRQVSRWYGCYVLPSVPWHYLLIS